MRESFENPMTPQSQEILQDSQSSYQEAKKKVEFLQELDRKASLLEFEDKLVRIILFEHLTRQVGDKVEKDQPPRENILIEPAKQKVKLLQDIFEMDQDRSRHLNHSITLDLLKKDIKIRDNLKNNIENIIFLNIEHATSLYPKDNSLSNNPFFTVNYNDQEWISSTQYNTLNPIFNETITICVTEGDIIIHLWNRNSKNKANSTKYHKDAHLGLIVITPLMIVSKQYRLNLQKRHKRSHCSGTLDFSIEYLCKKPTSQIPHQCYKLLVVNPKYRFEQFLSKLLLFELKTNDLKSIDKITKANADLIKSIMYYWEIDEYFYLLTTFKILVVALQKKSVGLEIILEVYNICMQKLCPPMKVNRTQQRKSGSFKNASLVITPEEHCQILSDTLNEIIRNLFFDGVRNSKEFEIILSILKTVNDGQLLITNKVVVYDTVNYENPSSPVVLSKPFSPANSVYMEGESVPDVFKPLPDLPISPVSPINQNKTLPLLPPRPPPRPDGKIIARKEIFPKQTLFETTTQRIDFEKHIRDSIAYALHLKYRNLVETSKALEPNLFITNYYLVLLTKTIIDELNHIESKFDLIICDKIHFPSFCAGLYFSLIECLYEDFSYSLKKQNFDVGFVLELYQNVRRLQIICEKIDFKLAESFKIVMWFRIAIFGWLDTLKTKVNEWVENSLKQDDFKLLSESHSSCVLDVFTSFQNAFDFIRELDWPDENDQFKFYFAVLYDIVLALEKFEGLLYSGIIKDLEITRGFQPPPAAKSAKLGKLKVPIPKMIRKKVLQSPVGSCRISSEVCVRMLNLCAIPGRFDALCLNIPSFQTENSESFFEKGHRRIVCVTILDAELRAFKGWSKKISIRLSSEDGKRLGESSKIYQSPKVTWNESMYIVCTEEELKFTIDVLYNHGSKFESFNGQSFKTGRLRVRNEKIVIIEIMGGGKLRIQFKVLPETIRAFTTTVNTTSEALVSKVTENLISQLTYDFRSRIHPISLKFKKHKFLKNDKENEALLKEEIDQIENYLAPLFEFMNSNLEVLMVTLGEKLALKVVAGVWNQFCQDAEKLIVPSLESDSKEQKQWDRRRFMFFERYIKTAEHFFVVDGEGISKKDAEESAFKYLKLIMDHYFYDIDTLEDILKGVINEYRLNQTRFEPDSVKSSFQDDCYWILKLLKMKAGKEHVEPLLQWIGNLAFIEKAE